MNTPLIAAHGLTKTFHFSKTRESFVKIILGRSDRKRTTEGLLPLSLEVNAGESVALVGRNGSGKSTALKILSGIMQPTSGTVTSRGKRIPLIYPAAFMYWNLDLKTNLENALRFCGCASPRESGAEILRLLKLADRSHIPVAGFSRGTVAMITLAAGLYSEASVYFIDELLDCLHTDFRDIARMLLRKRLAAGSGAVITTHDEEIIHQFCGRTVELDSPAP